MLQMISDLQNQLASITSKLDSDVDTKRGAELEMKNLEQNQPPDEQKISESEREAIQMDQNLNQSLIQNNTKLVPYGYPPFRLS